MTHNPIDEKVDQIILELWSRSLCTIEGKKATDSEADIFAVFLRAASFALLPILGTNAAGVFIEPKASTNRGPDPNFKIIWLPGANHAQALHAARTFNRTVCLVRFGIRVHTKDEEQAFKALRPGVPFISIDIQRIYSLFPVPHGTQRNAMCELLANWNWPAKVLQPGRSSNEAMSWTIGAKEEPPATVINGFGQEILVTEVKQLNRTADHASVTASRKTQHIHHVRSLDRPGARPVATRCQTRPQRQSQLGRRQTDRPTWRTTESRSHL